MTLVLCFGVVLLAATLLSERARRTVLSSSVLFLIAGFVLGRGGLGWIQLEPEQRVVTHFSELALFSVLFVDATRLRLAEVRSAWHLPGRALLLGLPLTLFGVAVAARVVLDASWEDALLIGSILSPTDPVFAAAILEHEVVPLKLRRLLSIESGLNDGLALPFVLFFLGRAHADSPDPLRYLADAGAGMALGVAIAGAFAWLERRHFFGASPEYRPLGGLAIATTVLGCASKLGINEFLGAFAAGVTLATINDEFARDFRAFGEPAAEAFKLAALLAFGSILTFPELMDAGAAGFLFAALTLLAARPMALLLSFLGDGISRKEWLAAAWFGPKGFASVLYALLVFHSGIPRATWVFHVIALVAAISMIAHSSTDVLVARWFLAHRRSAKHA